MWHGPVLLAIPNRCNIAAIKFSLSNQRSNVQKINCANFENILVHANPSTLSFFGRLTCWDKISTFLSKVRWFRVSKIAKILSPDPWSGHIRQNVTAPRQDLNLKSSDVFPRENYCPGEKLWDSILGSKLRENSVHNSGIPGNNPWLKLSLIRCCSGKNTADSVCFQVLIPEMFSGKWWARRAEKFK